MLDSETKRRIDTARDILVGKVPDPKSQVEQITIALVYKFMDDMDKEAVEMGGNASFFTGDYERYAWSKIFNPRIGGHEMLGLYGEAIVKLNQNPNLPQLFRDIFKNAYLPYRDPETLKLFLKIINEFTYDHSERLGDAFEYLLSVLGSQGDAGQFRTPRHIIDFMVAVTKPLKTEKILDPACGTAGFLISAYKHILQANSKKHSGDLLTAEERKRLLANFRGYDISPDMVRLSLVNMYLHGFVQPQITEYDTLTSEDRWNEYYDVVLANPPFMSPKGGIRPHKKFSVQSNRSEVLFVDYIAEHLTSSGRAAVIVPEGIIFQSANAYKQLRKLLVENYLYAVVSLPAGVFNPYSGVKTSILLLDKQLSKKTDAILFMKVENDGYGLGAQRREIDKNDLPDAANVITDYIAAARSGKLAEYNVDGKPCGALLVKKETLAENGEYNLTGDRYRVLERRGQQKWPMIKLSEIVSTITPPKKILKVDYKENGEYPIVDQSQVEIAGWSDDESALISEGLPFVIFGDHTCVVKYLDRPFIQGADGIKIITTCDMLSPKYLFFLLKTHPVESDGYKRHFSKLREIKIPLPPLEVQREIVAEIEGYQKIIDGARQVVDNWKPQIDIDPEWPVVKLGDVCGRISDGIDPNDSIGEVKYIGLENIEPGTGLLTGSIISQYNEIKSTKNAFVVNDVLFGKLRPNLNKVHLAKFTGICSTDIYVLRPNNNIVPEYLDICMRAEGFNMQVMKGISGAQLPRVGFNYMADLLLSLPPLEIQREIVAKIEAERKVIDGCRELIAIYEAKIKRVIDKVWEE